MSANARLPLYYEPYAKFNPSKTHYFFSIPKSTASGEGYSGVVDVSTNKVIFEMEEYFSARSVFIYQDASKIIAVEDSLAGNVVFVKMKIYSFDNRDFLKVLTIGGMQET